MFGEQIGNKGDVLETHSQFLIAASPYFEKLLTLKKAQNEEKKCATAQMCVDIPDMNYSTIFKVVKFIYTREFEFVDTLSLMQVRSVFVNKHDVDYKNHCGRESMPAIDSKWII